MERPGAIWTTAGAVRMAWRVRKASKVFARGASLRRRVAYSLGLVRLILVPVIFLAIYYLFTMGRIVDRIVSVEAPVATQAERASVEMLEARRAERNYFLLHDPEDLDANHQAIARLGLILSTCRTLEPDEEVNIQRIEAQVKIYEQRLAEARLRLGAPGETPVARVHEVVQAYEKDLDDLLRRAKGRSRGQLMEDLRNRVGSIDVQITAAVVAEDPELRQTSMDLRASGDEVVRLASELESRSWERVVRDHAQARNLVRRAEWVLGIVSALTLLVSIWVSFVLPRAVVRPLVELRAAVDRAAAGDYEIEFDVQGEGEVVALAASVRSLIDHVREKKTTSAS